MNDHATPKDKSTRYPLEISSKIWIYFPHYVKYCFDNLTVYTIEIRFSIPTHLVGQIFNFKGQEDSKVYFGFVRWKYVYIHQLYEE